jgi:hypothetical protein
VFKDASNQETQILRIKKGPYAIENEAKSVPSSNAFKQSFSQTGPRPVRLVHEHNLFHYKLVSNHADRFGTSFSKEKKRHGIKNQFINIAYCKFQKDA